MNTPLTTAEIVERVTGLEAGDVLDEFDAIAICEAASALLALEGERDQLAGMIKAREALHAANLGVDFDKVAVLTARDLAGRLLAAEAELAKVREALLWYEENVRNCRKITSEGNDARHALDRDGGERARAALAEKTV